MRLDAVIFGGGVAGLWLLDRLTRRGERALLLESHALGAGQTVGSQGIIHGGLKYTLQGLLTRSAKSIREMPTLWRQALAGQIAPNLKQTDLRASDCYLWHTDSLGSKAGMIGARIGLRVRPEVVPPNDRPACLTQVSGTVARLAEQVIAPASFLNDLRAQHQARLLKIDAQHGLRFRLSSPGEVTAIELTSPEDPQRKLQLEPRHVVFTAGAGNARLREMVGLDSAVMQRRPLHMVLARGPLPILNGHCVDGARTRVTITSERDSEGRVVWQIGGNVAEVGVKMDSEELIRFATQELQAVLPQLRLSDVEWSTYRVDRAEGVTPHGERPESIQVLCAGNVTTGWPTKLALAPVLAEEIAGRVTALSGSNPLEPLTVEDWPRPDVALLPWEMPERIWLPTQPAAPRRAA